MGSHKDYEEVKEINALIEIELIVHVDAKRNRLPTDYSL